MKNNNSKGAMEMSVGTIVTIVLLMSVLVLGLFFISKIFSSSNSAIDSVSQQLTTQINQAFSSGSTDTIADYPSSRQVTIKKGSSPPSGFTFSVYNQNTNQKSFTYNVSAYGTSSSNCGSTMTDQIADSYIISGRTGAFTLPPSSALTQSQMPLVLFSVPQNAPACTVTYNIYVYDSSKNIYTSSTMAVTFQ